MPRNSPRRAAVPVGQKFGHLLVIGDCGVTKDGAMLWLAVCECGNEYAARANNIQSGRTVSCGCLRKTLGLDVRTGQFLARDPVDRFFEFIEKTSTCWNWIGGKDKDGYGVFFDGRRTVRAHRYSYELFVAPIPKGLQPDHLCKNTSCINPDHLEPVTPLENFLRGDNPAALNRRKRQCLRGHNLDGPNLYLTSDGRRQCKICSRLRTRRYQERKANHSAPENRL